MGHFVEQLLGGTGVGDVVVAVKERGVGGGVWRHAHAEEEAVGEEEEERACGGGTSAEEGEEAVVVGEEGDELESGPN